METISVSTPDMVWEHPWNLKHLNPPWTQKSLGWWYVIPLFQQKLLSGETSEENNGISLFVNTDQRITDKVP